MARPYSVDLRERVVRAVEAGASCRAAAAKFAVSVSFVVKLMQRWRRRGTVAPDRYGGWKRSPLSAHADRVLALVAARPDLTLEELRGGLAAERRRGPAARRSVGSSTTTGLTRKKKTRHAAEQDRPDVAAARAAWRAAPAGAEPGAPGIHRRDLGHDHHGQAPWPGAARPALGRRRAPWPLEDEHLPRRAAPGSDHRTVRLRRCHQRRTLSGLCRAGSGADARTGRRRDHGQSRRPQGGRRARSHRGPWRATCSTCRPTRPT